MRVLRIALVLTALAAVAAGGAAYRAQAHTTSQAIDLLGHDSRDPAYRSPGGAVTTGTRIRLRFRTGHGDASAVTARVWRTSLAAEQLVSMSRVAVDVPCSPSQPSTDCDFWEATVDAGAPGTLYYRFIVTEGSSILYYEEASDVRDGGWGKEYAASPDWGWAVTVYAAAFKPVPWMRNAIVYQIFPDRFRNANRRNDPAQGNPRHYVWSKDKRYAYPHGDPQHESTPKLDQIVRMPWGKMPEGYCRNYADALKTCHKRFPPQKQVGTEGPHGRDYFGGDLQGITQKIGYLKGLGVTVLYLNPIFAAGSNHRYDTRSYSKIDPYLGTTKDFKKLVKAAHKAGMKVILDGVFNHMSSDSPIFDRYHNWKGTGACESPFSDWRGYFTFRKPNKGEPKPCAGGKDGESEYNSWAGFDSLPVLTEVTGVKDFVYGPGAPARKWLKLGADGWRLDVMQDKSVDFWRGFRAAVHAAKPSAIIIGELWKKFDVLPYVNGDTADTSMDYRFRDAVVGLLAPHDFDSKGFPGSGKPITPSDFAARILSIREDYPDATYDTLMNLVDSHDTERIRWTLTPGPATRAARERNAANVAEGRKRMALALALQLYMPGAPTIYYGDEAGMTGGDDPDDRRSFPWGDKATRKLGDTRRPDAAMVSYTRKQIARRRANGLPRGDIHFLLTDDANDTLAYGIKDTHSALVMVMNLSKKQQVIHVPVGGFLPGRTELVKTVPGLGATWLVFRGDLTPPAAVAGMKATAHNLTVRVTWKAVPGAAGYDVYRTPLSGGEYTKVGHTAALSFDDSTGRRSGVRYYYMVRALDAPGNASAASTEASAVPSYKIDAVSLDRPSTLDYTVSAVDATAPVYGRVLIAGVTSGSGAAPGVLGQVGFGKAGGNPSTWSWSDMTYSGEAAGGRDEYSGTMQPSKPGAYAYRVRFSTNQGVSWRYGAQTGTLAVHANPDHTPPPAPKGLAAKSRGSSSIGLSWNAVAASDLYRYAVYRSAGAGGPYAEVGRVDRDTTKLTDTGLKTGTRYFYVVKSLDEAGNLSAASREASGVPSALQVDVNFVVTPPKTTPANATVYIAGNDPQLCAWCNPHTVKLAKGGDGKWTKTITFPEGTKLEYKYTLGSWDYVEKGGACDEIANRAVTVAPEGDSDAMTVNDTVKNWRNVKPCGS